jgi:hypothetical protein
MPVGFIYILSDYRRIIWRHESFLAVSSGRKSLAPGMCQERWLFVLSAFDACSLHHKGGAMLTRRQFLKIGAAGAGLFLTSKMGGSVRIAYAQIPGGTLDPLSVTKFVTPLLIPPVMPRAGTIVNPMGKPIDYYEISMRQITQQILPAGLPPTTVWGYGAVKSASKKGLLITMRCRYHRGGLNGRREVD